ncbi:hypothetical protein Scep_013912 [Stephania cephalantha]|uniref:RRM domain-containing protein n=1 Tax=Stephania cephalantha TaxID=152367 RepID=A0AAP0P2H3_9MAGN
MYSQKKTMGSREEYSVERLKKIFGAFGEVEDVVVQSKKKNKKTINALVVMASKDGTVAAMGVYAETCRILSLFCLREPRRMRFRRVAGEVVILVV